ncbi:hypothetical protein D3C78_1065690 [compost metagenome]
MNGFVKPVGLHNGFGGGHGCRVDFRAEEVPAIVAVADQWIDAVGAHADIEHLHRRAPWDLSVVDAGQQVGEKVHVIRTTRNRGAEVVGRDIPMRDAVERLEQRPIEHPHRIRAGEIDALFAVGVDDHELRQFRRALDQRREIVTALVAVARMQAGLFAGRHGFGRGRGLRLLARRFGGAGGVH